MKKIIILLVLILTYSLSKGQGYPVPQSIGSDSALVTSKGGLKGRMVVWNFSDTAQANQQRIKEYAGALIFTMDAMWFRDSSRTKWVQIIPSGSPVADSLYWSLKGNLAAPNQVPVLGTINLIDLNFETNSQKRFSLNKNGILANNIHTVGLGIDTATGYLGYGGSGGGLDTINLQLPIYGKVDTVLHTNTIGMYRASSTDSGYVIPTQVNYWNNGGGSTLLQVTGRGNTFDTIRGRNLVVPAVPTSIVGNGDSQSTIPSIYVTSLDSIYLIRLALSYGLPATSLAVGGTGAYSAASLFLQNINPLHRSIAVVETGFNDVRYGGNNQKTYRKITNAHVAIFCNQFLKSYVAPGDATSGVIRYGSMAAGYAGISVGGKTNNGAFGNLVGDSLRYTFFDSTVVIGGIAGDGVTQIHSNSIKLYIDGVLKKTVSENNQTDGITVAGNDNARSAMAFIITGLTYGQHVLTVINNDAQYCIVDYIGHLVDVTNAYPFIILDPPKMNGAGYATAPANATNAIMDSVSVKLDSTVASYPTGYPVYHVHTNNFYVVATGLGGDNIHLNDVGHGQEWQGILASLPSIPSNSITDGSIFTSGGRLHEIINGSNETFATLTDVNALTAGTGISKVGNTISANISTGLTSGQSIFGGVSTGENLTIRSNPLANGLIKLGLNSAYDELRDYFGIGTITPNARLNIVNTTNAQAIRIKGNAGQTADLINVQNSGGIDIFKVDAGGGLQIFGDVTNPIGNGGLEIKVTGGAIYQDAYNRTGAAWMPLNLRSSTFSIVNSGTTAFYLSSGNAGFGGNTSPNSTLDVTAGSAAFGYVAKTATYSIAGTDYTIDCISGTFTTTLPTASGVTGRVYIVKNSGAGVVTVGTTSSQTIDGVTTYSLSAQYQTVMVQSDGSNWKVLSKN